MDDDITIRRTRFESWITEATNTHSQYVMLIAFPQQQQLHERALMLSYTYIASRFRCALLFGSQLFAINGVC
jgi:hypothetical protein